MDFKLDEFFRTSTKETLPDGTEITVRVLSDAELKARDNYTLNCAATIAEKLRDPNSEEHKRNIAPIAYGTEESVVYTLVRSHQNDWLKETYRAYPVLYYPYPDPATLQEKIETDAKQSDHELKVFAERTKYMLDRERVFRESKIKDWDREKLARETQARAIMLYAESGAVKEGEYYTIWLACEKDGQRYFRDVDHVSNLPEVVLNKLLAVYAEVDAVDPWQLTKSIPPRNDDGVGQNGSNGGSASIESSST